MNTRVWSTQWSMKNTPRVPAYRFKIPWPTTSVPHAIKPSLKRQEQSNATTKIPAPQYKPTNSANTHEVKGKTILKSTIPGKQLVGPQVKSNGMDNNGTKLSHSNIPPNTVEGNRMTRPTRPIPKIQIVNDPNPVTIAKEKYNGQGTSKMGIDYEGIGQAVADCLRRMFSNN